MLADVELDVHLNFLKLLQHFFVSLKLNLELVGPSIFLNDFFWELFD